MSRTIHCKKLGIESEGLSKPPYPGELGQRIYEEISQRAWNAWMSHQTMLINEYRLNLLEEKSRTFLETEMEKFLFSAHHEKPPGYVEPDTDKDN